MSGITAPYLLSGLTEGTAYEYYLVDSCSNGNWSDTIGAYSFTTDPLPTASFIKSMTPASGRLDTVQWGFNSVPSQNDTVSVWDFGDGSPTVMGNLVTHDYTANGTYNVVLTVWNHCGSATDTQVVIINTVSIDEFGALNMNVYPNPSGGKFTIDNMKTTIGKVQLNIVNGMGQTVYSEELYSGQKEVNVDISSLQDGVYYVRLISDEGIESKPITIQH